MNIQYVPLHLVHQVWPKISHYLEAAFVHDPDVEFDIGQLQTLVVSGVQELYVAVDGNGGFHGAITVQFINSPKYRTAWVSAIGGKLMTSRDTYQQFVDILKTHGATKLAGGGRPAIVRLWRRLGLKDRHVVVETRLI